jgi:hypothetical protein
MAPVSATLAFMGLIVFHHISSKLKIAVRIVQVMAVAPILHVSATKVGMENFATALFLPSIAIQTLVCKVVTAMEVVPKEYAFAIRDGLGRIAIFLQPLHSVAVQTIVPAEVFVLMDLASATLTLAVLIVLTFFPCQMFLVSQIVMVMGSV